MKKVETISLSALSNAYHVSFMSNVKSAVDKAGVSALGLNADSFAAFGTNLAAEKDIVNRSRASNLTRTLATLDATRDDAFRRIWYKLKAATYDSQNAAISDELITLINDKILKLYPLSIVQDPNQVESAKLHGMVVDIEQFIGSATESLGIKDDIEQLETANTAYERTYMARISEKNAYVLTPRKAREATEVTYAQITFSLAATANTVVTASTADALKQTIANCSQLIDELNILIADFKRKALKIQTEGSEDIEDPETPENPETPEDPAENPETPDSDVVEPENDVENEPETTE